MFNDATIFLSLIVFLPALGALLLAFIPGDRHELVRYVTLAVTIAVLVLCVVGFLGDDGGTTKFEIGESSMQSVFNHDWIPSFNIYYYMGVDGISFPLVMLTALVSVLAMAASWSITKQVKAYCILFLLLETGMMGVFLALDFFLFYVFWEVMLLPMYFLIGVWGGPRREYAAIKFFLYTLVGSVLMLIAILMLYFNSDLGEFARLASAEQWDRLTPNLSEDVTAKLGRVTSEDGSLDFVQANRENDSPISVRFESSDALGASVSGDTVTVVLGAEANQNTPTAVAAAINENVGQVLTVKGRGDDLVTASAIVDDVPPAVDYEVHTFNIRALAAIGQHTNCFDDDILFSGWTLQHWSFLLLFIGFAIKVPSVPLHTWLPDAHVEAPTPISMILAGVLLKMGGYGIIRICYPICPAGGFDFAYFVCLVGVVSMVYGAFAALAQNDFKRMVAYSSVSHMGYVVLGLGVWSATSGTAYNSDYWNMGVQGAMFQMIAHGISSTGMFFMVGVIYDRVHHRNLNEFGGLFAKMPVYTAFAIGIFFAGLGLPGLCGFVGEVFVVLSVFKYSIVLAVISASVVVLTAAYILWALQRVYLGAEYKGPHPEALTPSTPRENAIAGVLFVLAILLGVLPYQTVLRYMDQTVERQVEDLAEWTKVKRPNEEPRDVVETRVPATQDTARTGGVELEAASASVPDLNEQARTDGDQRSTQLVSNTTTKNRALDIP